MAHISERVTIAAPAAAVWEAVHEDMEAAPRWAGYLKRAVLLDGDTPGPGRRVRYDLDLPGSPSLVLLPSEWDRPHRCAGRFDGGPVEGTWSYTYREREGATDLHYEMDYRMAGLLRFAGGMLQSRYEDGVRQGMAMLRRYLEEKR